ncbi:MAG: NifU family protein [Rhizobacter sp.]|nr:NifU family protein [Chlorobiales bacterium]
MTQETATAATETTVAAPQYQSADSPIHAKVQTALDGIRPYLQSDGGDAIFLGITADNIVDLKLVGACGSCPMSTMTLRAGVEQAIKRAVPEVVRVEANA